jgi:hypothetical protein
MFDEFDEPVPAWEPPKELDSFHPTRSEAEKWLARSPHPIYELWQAFERPVFHAAELVPLIRGRTDLSDAHPRFPTDHRHPRLLLLPALLARIAAPNFSSPGDAFGGGGRVVSDACEEWLEQRYVPLAHAQIRQLLWPEFNLSSIRNLIIDYFGAVRYIRPPSESEFCVL